VLVGRVAASADIDIDYAKGGTIAFARSTVQLEAAREEVEEAQRYGVDETELWGIHRVKAAGALGASYDPACARIHPAKLVRGLARSLEKRGVTIFEQTEVLDYAPRTVFTSGGTVRAENVVIATEGYGATLRATRRRMLPLVLADDRQQSRMTDAAWDEMGIAHGQTFTDFRHLLVYGQRTADNRFAFGGRGARYHWGSAIRPEIRPGSVACSITFGRHCCSNFFPSDRRTCHNDSHAGAVRLACRVIGMRPPAMISMQHPAWLGRAAMWATG
jgi:glycine/D-amino acid oxidase-like deaminating enzyme